MQGLFLCEVLDRVNPKGKLKIIPKSSNVNGHFC